METYLVINLPAPVTVQAAGNVDVVIDKIEISEMIDNIYKKQVEVICRNHPVRIILWEGASYDAIGQWTDTDVTNRVLELYSTP